MVRLAPKSAPGETKTTLAPLRPVESVVWSRNARRKFLMSALAIVVIAFGMSMDAFAAALAKGATLHRPSVNEALRTGIIFGTIEAITPIIGWAAGLAAASFVDAVDHWIALFLLGGVGGKMIYESFQPEAERKPRQHSLLDLATTAIGTSIDAMAVGVTLAFLDAEIVVVAGAIGLTTFAMTTTGVMIGRYAGVKLGKRAELVGGIGLIALGVRIFVQHTMGI